MKRERDKKRKKKKKQYPTIKLNLCCATIGFAGPIVYEKNSL